MSEVSIADALRGKILENETATLKGWVRPRRDSKGGFSFVSVHDGSCFDAIQVVAANTLPNYTAEIMHLPTGCSVIARGTMVKSQGKGQAFEIQASEIKVVGLVDDPDTYPVSP